MLFSITSYGTLICCHHVQGSSQGKKTDLGVVVEDMCSYIIIFVIFLCTGRRR